LILQCSMFYFVIRSCILCSDILYESFSTNMLRLTSFLNKCLKSNTLLDWWLNLPRAVGVLLFVMWETCIVIRGSLFLVLHYFSLFHSCTRAVLLFVKFCFSESVRVILFSFQASTHFVILHFLELGAMIPFCLQFAFTIALFVAWVQLKSYQIKAKKLTDSMWSILLDSSCPPDFPYANRYFPSVVRNAPRLCLCMWLSSFWCFVILFWSWPTAWLIMQCSMFCFVLFSMLSFFLGLYLTFQGFVRLQV
jgi:hypothetical protein